jgi:drug/metabolite transporter (DMT)-like permease
VSVISVQDAIIKGMSGAYSVHQIVFVRSAVGIALLIALIASTAGLGTLATRRPLLHLVRGVILFSSYMFYYLAMAALPIAETVSIFFTVPLFIAALSMPLLGERVGPRRWAAIAIGFFGVLVILRPGGGIADPAALLALAAALTYAVSALLGRRLGATDSGGTIALSGALVYLMSSGLLGILLAPFSPPDDAGASLRFLLMPWSWPEHWDFMLLALCGVISAIGMFFLAQGYRLAEANAAAPFEYVALPWGILWGYVFFDNLPGWTTIIGAVVIVACGFYVFHRERRSRSAR